MVNELQKRLFQFAVDVFKLLKEVPDTGDYKIYKYQLIKCSSPCGANYEEAQGAASHKDFINKVRISLNEIRESNYFLRLLDATNENRKFRIVLQRLITESTELKLILGAIIIKAKKK